MFMESFKTSSGETIHTAIGPLQTMQKEIIDVLTKTKDRVTAIEEDNDSTKVNFAEANDLAPTKSLDQTNTTKYQGRLCQRGPPACSPSSPTNKWPMF